MPTKRIRILADTRIEDVLYRSNELVELDEKLVTQAVTDGVADDHPEAVRYLEETGSKAKKHGPTEDTKPEVSTPARKPK